MVEYAEFPPRAGRLQYSVLSIALPSITVCFHTHSLLGPWRHSHLQYVSAFGLLVVFACWLIASRRPVAGHVYW